jgi:hypothetical protein
MIVIQKTNKEEDGKWEEEELDYTKKSIVVNEMKIFLFDDTLEQDVAVNESR